MFTVDEQRCSMVAGRCKSLKIRNSHYERAFLNFDADRETKLRVYLFSAAICHQTHLLHHPGLNLWGWDYLEYGFLRMFWERNVFLNPGYLTLCKEIDVEQMLLLAFSPDGNTQRCTLDRRTERAAMLVEICHELKHIHQAKVSKLIDAAEGRLIHSGNGLYESLSKFAAFSDPYKKKITFFIKLAVEAGVLMVRDPENLIPIMDYHMQRVLLRMGCVKFSSKKIMYDLAKRKKMDSDQDIRVACIDAMKIISQESGHGILKLNDYFWPLGRSCCNETTLCSDHRCAKSPCSFFRIAETDDHKACYFEDCCKGSSDKVYRSLWEPKVETSYY